MTVLKPLAAILLIAGPAAAQDHSGHVMTGAMPAYMATMDTMMQSMQGMESTGNPDADFLMMMIPHHQSAVDMAEVELEHGTDDETREMAQKIIDAQNEEIAQMTAMLDRMGVKMPE